MASKAPIALILGYGRNIGAAAARRFRGLGYDVAVVSRPHGKPSRGLDPSRTAEGYLSLKADLADTSVYASIYAALSENFAGGAAGPDFVVFNAASLTTAAEPGNLFSVPLEGFQSDLELGVKGAYVAAREAHRLWSASDDGRKRQFIYTGNKLATEIWPAPDFLTLGTVKNASAYVLGAADKLYKDKGFRFFIADQRKPDGSPAGQTPDAEAHAELFTRIARDPAPWPFYITFVDGTKDENFAPGKWE